MKAQVTITITVAEEGKAERLFSHSTPPETYKDGFQAVAHAAEGILGNVHRAYCPTPEEQAEPADDDAKEDEQHLAQD